MMLSFSVSFIWLLAMLASAAFVHDSKHGAAGVFRMALAFPATLAVALWLSPQPNWVGVLVGVIASWRLISGPFGRAGGLFGGVCAGLAAALQVAGGVPLWIAAALAVGALALVAWLPRASASRDLPREMMVVVAALAVPLFGLAADLVYGWHSAAVLNRGASVGGIMPPVWAIAIVVLAIVAGAIRGIWARR